MKRREADGKLQLVVGIHPESYKVTETRLNKPVCFKRMEQGVEPAILLADPGSFYASIV